MGLKERLGDLGRAVATVAGDTFQDFGESGLFKADDGKEQDQDEGQQRGPGGSSEDTSDNAPVPTEAAKKDPKSLFWDPFAIIEQLGYKDRPSQVTYNTLKSIAYRVPVIQAVIQTRVNEVAAFARPQHDRYEMGYRIKLRDPKQEPTEQDTKWMEQAEALIMRTGVTENPRGRDNFETFLRKLCWDSLVYDQMCFETVPNKLGQPAEWYAVDSSTIRLADSAATYMNEDLDKAIRYVQIYDQVIISEYSQEEMFFGVRNPRTDLRLYGYGVAELEMLIPTVTSILWASEYNAKFFSQGSTAKGILNFKGAIPEKSLRQFRRYWYSMLSGATNAWRTPITNAEELQWVNMQQTNREMEFSAYFDWLLKQVCAVFLMSPDQINFKYGNTGQKSALNEASNREKIIESKERGLRPLLRFIANAINQQIIWPINENFEFEFVGLETTTREEVAKMNQMRVKTTMTVDELRAEDDLPPLPDDEGTILLDPTFIQARTAKEQAAQQKEMMAQGQNPFGGDGEEGDDEGGEFGDADFTSLMGDDDEDDDEDAGDTKKSMSGMNGKRVSIDLKM